jgi:glycosyltransferase involved in cell wall biosynthesis
MRVHILGTRGFPSSYGGFETLMRYLAPYLVRQGHEVTVFDRTKVHRTADRCRTVQGVRVYSSVGLDGNASSTLSHGLTSALVTARERPDAALVMNVANGFFLPLLRARGVPVVLNVDGIEWERAKWSPMGRRVFRAGARCTSWWADTLIADSREIARRWLADFGRDSVFVPYGGDAAGSGPGPDRVLAMGLAPQSYVLIVARLVPENNVELMLQAARSTGAPVVIVGSANGSALEDRIFAQHAPPAVTALGHVGDQELLSALWAHCGVYLHGHSVGGTNPALVQAMGLGAPVLALDTPYNREVLLDDERLVPPDPTVIGRRASELLGSGAARRSAAVWAQSRVTDVYNWASVCAAYDTALRSVTGAGVPATSRMVRTDAVARREG